MALITVKMEIPPASLRLAELLIQQSKRSVLAADKKAKNTAIRRAKVLAKKALAKSLNIPARMFTEKHRFGGKGSESTGVPIRTTTAKLDGSPATIEIVGRRRIPLSFFKARNLPGGYVRVPPRPQKNGKVSRRKFARRYVWTKGVRYKIGAQAQVTIKDAFLAKTKTTRDRGLTWEDTGGKAVFIRKGSPGLRVYRLPLYTPKGPSIGKHAQDDPELRRALELDLTQVYLKSMQDSLSKIANKKGIPTPESDTGAEAGNA